MPNKQQEWSCLLNVSQMLCVPDYFLLERSIARKSSLLLSGACSVSVSFSCSLVVFSVVFTSLIF